MTEEWLKGDMFKEHEHYESEWVYEGTSPFGDVFRNSRTGEVRIGPFTVTPKDKQPAMPKRVDR